MAVLNLEIIEKLRELIWAEVFVGISGAEEDESGYRGNNHAERKYADKIFDELKALLP